jgi:hypothetical protein
MTTTAPATAAAATEPPQPDHRISRPADLPENRPRNE